MGGFMHFRILCGRCGHRNQPHRSPREGIRLALLDQLPSCKKCGKELHLTDPGERPLVREVRAQLIHEGLLAHPELVPA